MVGALNMISVAFAVLFVGLGVDFGIQFGVRYRAERHERDDLDEALRLTARDVGTPPTLAATATAAAFFCFLPTDYRGVAELGKIAGVGMFVAYATTFTLLPALIRVLRPKGEAELPGFGWLAPADAFFERHRKGRAGGRAGGDHRRRPAAAAPEVRFRSAAPEGPAFRVDVHAAGAQGCPAGRHRRREGAGSVAGMRAQRTADKLGALPEVERVLALRTFIPDDQAPKLAIIAEAGEDHDAGAVADPVRPGRRRCGAWPRCATPRASSTWPPSTIPARARASRRASVALAEEAVRCRTRHARPRRARHRPAAAAGAGHAATLPACSRSRYRSRRCRRNFCATGWPRTARRCSASRPSCCRRGAQNEAPRAAALDHFLDVMARVQPDATGGPIAIRGSADTIVTAFGHAGLWAVLSITVLLLITLRRIGDVLRTT